MDDKSAAEKWTYNKKSIFRSGAYTRKAKTLDMMVNTIFDEG